MDESFDIEGIIRRHFPKLAVGGDSRYKTTFAYQILCIEQILRQNDDSIAHHPHSEVMAWSGLGIIKATYNKTRRKLVRHKVIPQLNYDNPQQLPEFPGLNNSPGDAIDAGDLRNAVITKEEFTKSLVNCLTREGLTPEGIEQIASYVMDFFGYDDCIVDNALRAKDRDIFYMLEEDGFFKTESEEVTIQKGKVWRIHYWLLNKKKIVECANAKVNRKRAAPADYSDVYANISEDVWRRG